MVSRAALLSGLVLLLSGFFPLKKGNVPREDAKPVSTHITDVAEEDWSQNDALNSIQSLSLGERFQNDVTYQFFLYHTRLSPDKPAQENNAKGPNLRKVDSNKVPVRRSDKSTKNYNRSEVQYDPLMKMLFEQKFKIKRNTSTTGRHKTHTWHRPHHRVSTSGTAGSMSHRDRMDNILKILAVFGEHFQTDQALAGAAMDTPSETVTVTTQHPSISHRDMSCIHVEGYDMHQWIHIVNFCARDWKNQTTRYMCKDAMVIDYAMTDTPVQDTQGTVYANRYCAFCNHIPVTKIRKWQIAWTCEKNDNPVAFLMHPELFGDLMDIVKSLRLGNKCQMIRTPAIPKAILGCSAPILRGSHSMPMVNANKHVPPGTGYPVSLNILMNFDFSGKTHIMFEDLYAEESIETKLCPQGNYVWDGELERCRKVVCADGYDFDETYTTCLKKDASASNTEEEVLTDLSQLAQSNDIERVTLEVEVPSGFAALVTITSNQFWKEQIAKQLNITITRIQKFNITVENGTGGASTLLIQKLSNGDLPSASEDEDSDDGDDDDDDDDEGGTQVYESTTVSDDVGDESSVDKHITKTEDLEVSTFSGNSKRSTSDEDSQATARSTDHVLNNNDDVDKNSRLQDDPELKTSEVESQGFNGDPQEDVTDTAQAVNFVDETGEPSGSETVAFTDMLSAPSASSEEDGEPHNFKIIMSFILLPPESFGSGEQRSGNVVEALSSLVSSKEFKFIINGTSLQVENMAQEDKVGVFSPACPHGVLLVLDGEQIELITQGDTPLGSNFTALKDLRTGKYYFQGMFDVSFIFTQPIGNTTEKPQSYVYNALACEMPRITDSHCSRIYITAEEYTIQPISKTLTFQNTTLNITSYEFLNDKYDDVEICLPESYKEAMAMHPSRIRYFYYPKNCYTDYQDWLKAEGYLTAILGRISIASLLAVLLTYILFPKLRNLPGVNTMNLTFSLFLAEVIFATGEEVQTPWLCTAVAASLHYCFLSSHCWMNVMSYDVYRTFAGSSCILTRVRDKRKMFPRYALYAWGMPLLVLGTCLLIDLGQVFPGLSIGYGGTWSQGFNESAVAGNWSGEETYQETVTTTTTTTMKADGGGGVGGGGGGEGAVQDGVKISNASEEGGDSLVASRSFSCWIQEPLAALFVFGAPVMLIFLANCAFFVKTIISIRQTNRLARHSGVGRTNSSNSARRISGHSDVILYVKMSSVMGFTWVFGLASSVISSVTQEPYDAICYILHVLGVIFPILNSSQGLFILFAFVVNRRVWGHYKALGRQIKTYIVKRTKSLEAARNKPMTNIATILKE